MVSLFGGVDNVSSVAFAAGFWLGVGGGEAVRQQSAAYYSHEVIRVEALKPAPERAAS